MLIVMVWVLWGVVLALVIAVWALARQVGVLFERVSPIGALMIDAGPKIGSAVPRFDLTTLGGARLVLGNAPTRSTLLFFLSPTCPVCKKLLPILRGIRSAESDWLDVVLASDGDTATHQRFVATNDLAHFPYVLSHDLGMTFRVSRLPFAVLIGEDGLVKAKGLVNNREQLESLFSAKELGVTSVQDYLGRAAPGSTT
jgi:methylamine dehydrogenase accessory protein MauD